MACCTCRRLRSESAYWILFEFSCVDVRSEAVGTISAASELFPLCGRRPMEQSLQCRHSMTPCHTLTHARARSNTLYTSNGASGASPATPVRSRSLVVGPRRKVLKLMVKMSEDIFGVFSMGSGGWAAVLGCAVL